MDAPPVQYVRTSDGWTVAYSVFGEGPPLVVAPVTFHHLQMVWQDGEWGEWLSGLAPQYQIVLHDHRGTGLSGRGLLPDYQPLDRVLDLESVVDCLGLGRFALLAAGSASHPSAVYAARHPHRVAALILISCSVSMRPWPTALHQQLARDNWDSFLHMVSQSPDGLEATSRIVEKRKRMVDQADFLTITHATSSSSIEVELEQVSAPTLVIHPRGQVTVP